MVVEQCTIVESNLLLHLLVVNVFVTILVTLPSCPIVIVIILVVHVIILLLLARGVAIAHYWQ